MSHFWGSLWRYNSGHTSAGIKMVGLCIEPVENDKHSAKIIIGDAGDPRFTKVGFMVAHQLETWVLIKVEQMVYWSWLDEPVDKPWLIMSREGRIHPGNSMGGVEQLITEYLQSLTPQ